MKNYLLTITLLFFTIFTWSQGLKTQGKKIVDQNGNEVILRGMGLGGWMLQEGYMMQSSDVADTQHEFKDRLIDLMGEEKTNEFYDAWLANHVTKKDIDSLASWGYNSVRLPMHYNLFTLPIENEPIAGQNTWLDKGFDMVDDLLDWCESNSIYLILDLHAAPGGQGANAAISDYDPSKPSLWESAGNRDKTVALWKKIADRYKDEAWIGGYDLLNEVNWNLSGNSMLKSLYQEITTSIREVDTNHIIFIEGNGFANDFSGLTPPWDDNMAYSFHKYWNYNDPGSIQWVLNLREQQNVPLWMGEAGENSNVWFHDAIKLFEDNGIGWSWWPMKRIETIVGPYSVTFSEGYKNILSYWRGQTGKPTEAAAYEAMMELANNTNSLNCSYQKDVHDAQIRQVTTDETIPYSQHSIPGVVHMSDYDMGKLGKAYYDVDYANYSLSTGEFQAWNSGWMYRNDGVDIQNNDDTVNSNGFHVGYLRKGEWMNYTVQVDESATYTAKVRVATPQSGGKFHLSLDGEEITATQLVNATGGWTTFETFEIIDISLSQGTHVLTVYFDDIAEFNMSSLEFIKTGAIDALSFYVLNGETGEDMKSVEIAVNQPILTESLDGNLGNFSLEVNGVEQSIVSVTMDGSRERTIILTTENNLIYTDEIKVSYNGASINSQSGKILESFSDLTIRNTLPLVFILPGKIEAEDYNFMEGLATEATTDEGGGMNIGYTDPGDYADYLIYVENGGAYQINLRLAGQYDAGIIGFYIVNEDTTETALQSVTTPVTGGWQTWTTITTNLFIPEGFHTLRMRILSGGFNMNWMKFELLDTVGDLDNDGIADDEDQCPNTPEGDTVDESGCSIFTLSPDNFSIEAIGESCPDRDNGKIAIMASETHDYVVTFNGVSRSFTTGISFTSLAPDDYELCITVEGEEFEQCFSLRIAEGATLFGKSDVTKNKATIEILQGTAPYQIFVNGMAVLETMSSAFSVAVKPGDLLEVKSAIDCEGTFSKSIEMFHAIVVYPNPSPGLFEIAIPGPEREVAIDLYNIKGELISSKTYQIVYGKVQMSLENTPAGMYIAKLHLNNPLSVKIIKQ
jgi:hypothetical protein